MTKVGNQTRIMGTVVGGAILLFVGWFILNHLTGHHSLPPSNTTSIIHY